MARVLVHYDIGDPDARDSFRNAIQGAEFSPTFTRETESVYAAHISTTDTNLAALKQALQTAADDANVPIGSKIILERPSQTNKVPDIIRTPIR